ncbi:cobalt/nickel transport system ATP-binding protein [Thermosulfidibacter takaii ABI70S6]|uniref:Cobalt/nickel transport system ATP-binding protein n=1 Tax=Thermosulfidibacter takaii (strain DSM 17441 / JCM 13301 / NBRC 103674 / ABI70S6) TaxID=1298851 RepID=A0A0S3QUE8_THET7|nr:ATP-binding cassette domain-containing protein [Thermosulfidibacter takaii]BAT71932.1 cobalt/nickel transport system ATP-binding protein [Thermosulfidibacter takaii ABI70S6]
MEIAVQVEDLHYTYPDGTEALKGIFFSLKNGETLGVIGANGAGKSTLLLTLNGIYKGFSPKGDVPVRIYGMPVDKEHEKEIRKLVGLVFQDPDIQLFSPTVFDDVAFGPVNLGFDPDEVSARVKKALEAMGLVGYEKRTSHHLSYGEKKRVAIATVLSYSPKILALDEPTANLDPCARCELIKLLKRLPQTKVIASHDIDMIGRVCDKVLVLYKGRQMALGSVREILKSRRILIDSGLLPEVDCL